MEDWKRMYSNNDTKTVALPWFWEHFDKENFSLWSCEYKYADELKLIFMTCNLVGGELYLMMLHSDFSYIWWLAWFLNNNIDR